MRFGTVFAIVVVGFGSASARAATDFCCDPNVGNGTCY
jgi:hypothetical protein